MAGRRRRRARHAETDRPPPHPTGERAGAKAEARRREALEVRMTRLRRIRTVIGALGFVPLVASLLCGAGSELLCVVPREIYLGIWAALFGTFLGLTVRMWRARRDFERSGGGETRGRVEDARMRGWLEQLGSVLGGPGARALMSVVVVYALAWSSLGPQGGTLIGTAILVYLAPTYVALLRDRARQAPVILVNLFFGWTAIGWIIALIWATTGDTRAERAALRR